MLEKATAENFQDKIILASEEKVVFSYFYNELESEDQILSFLKNKVKENEKFVSLVTVDIEKENELAMQFGVETSPTLFVIRKQKVAAALEGDDIIANADELFLKILPKKEEIFFKQALENKKQEDFKAALENIDKSLEIEPENPNFILTKIDILIELDELAPIKNLFATIKTQDKDSYYKTLLAKFELKEKTKETPKLKELKEKVKNNESDLNLQYKLAIAYSGENKNKEALEILFKVYKKEKNLGDIDIKKTIIDIFALMPNDDKDACFYKNKLYSMLY